MPDSNVNALYPQPVAPPSASQNVFMGNPLDAAQKLIAIQGGQISNVTAQLEQDAKQTGLISSFLGSIDKNSSPDEIRSAIVTGSRSLPNIPAAKWSAINSQIFGDPKGPAHGLQTLQSIALGGAAGATRVAAPPGPGGEQQQQPASQSIFGGASPIGLAPGIPEKMQASATQYGADAGQAANWQGRAVALEHAIPLLEKLGPAGAGFAGEAKNEIRRVIVSLGGDPKLAENYESARKYLLRDAMLNGDTGSNERLYNTVASNPNIDLTQASASDLAKVNLAQYRLKQAQVLEAQRQGIQPGAYQDWAGPWNTSQDPNAYIIDHMNPKDRTAFVDKMTKYKSGTPAQQQQAKQFFDSYRTASRYPRLLDKTKYGQ